MREGDKTGRKFLIRCTVQNGANGEALWWGKNSCGYTINIDKAGIYTEEECRSRCCRDEPIPFDDAMGCSTVIRTVQAFDVAGDRKG